MPTEKYDDDDLAMLTPEELAGFDEGKDEDEAAEAAEAGADDGKTDGTDSEAADDKNAEGAADDSLPEVQSPPIVPDDLPEVKPVPLFKTDAPNDADARLAEIAEQRAALSARFDDGDITAKELDAERAKLDDAQYAIREAVFKAKLAAEAAEQQEVNEWNRTVKDFFADHAEIDRKNTIALRAFDTLVRQVTADKANAGLTGREQLELAYTTYRTAFNIPDPAAKPADKAAAANRNIPPTLARVPAAALNTDDSAFASLDRLMDSDPIKAEAVLARMAPADQNAYLRSR